MPLLTFTYDSNVIQQCFFNSTHFFFFFFWHFPSIKIKLTSKESCCKYFLFQVNPTNFYRNVEGRWSDGRLTSHRRKNRKSTASSHRDSLQRMIPGK